MKNYFTIHRSNIIHMFGTVTQSLYQEMTVH